jgi:hypothetical protein
MQVWPRPLQGARRQPLGAKSSLRFTLKSNNEARAAPQLYGMAVNQLLGFSDSFCVVDTHKRLVPEDTSVRFRSDKPDSLPPR